MTVSATETDDVRYAGFWRRVLAAIVDTIIVFLLGWIVFTIIGVPMFDAAPYQTGTPEEIMAAVSLANLASGITILVNWLYYAGFEAWGPQATPGKLAIGLKVTDLQGSRIGFGRASLRFWGKFVSALILMVGYLMVAFTKRKQGLHDIMSGCLVVRK